MIGRARVTTLLVAVCGPAWSAASCPAAYGANAASEEVSSGTFSVNAGFTSHLLQDPGAHLGGEYRLARFAQFESFAAAVLQFHHRQAAETAYGLHARWGQRYTSSFGLSFESQLGLGLQYTRYQTPVFEFEDAIASTVEHESARFGFVPQLSFGPGYDFACLTQVPIRIYARPAVMLVYPDQNDAFQAALNLELGLTWTP